LFAASFFENGSTVARVVETSQLLAVRISDFGGVLHNLVPGAALNNESLRAIAIKTRSRLDYLRFLTAVLFGRHTFLRKVELVDANTVECHNLNGSSARLFVEADGELLGTLPVRIEVVPQALTLLIPAKALNRKYHP
jgi:diacylglycerol kinase family enzyme